MNLLLLLKTKEEMFMNFYTGIGICTSEINIDYEMFKEWLEVYSPETAEYVENERIANGFKTFEDTLNYIGGIFGESGAELVLAEVMCARDKLYAISCKDDEDKSYVMLSAALPWEMNERMCKMTESGAENYLYNIFSAFSDISRENINHSLCVIKTA